MGDEKSFDGIRDDYPAAEETDAEVVERMKKIEELERENVELAEENAETKEQIKKLNMEIEVLKLEEEELKLKVGQLEEAKKASENAAARASELETEVSKLRHDLVLAMSEAGVAVAEVKELKQALDEKGKKAEDLEREVGSLKRANIAGETRVKDLEKKIGFLEAKEVEEKGKKIRLQEEMREKIDEKENEIGALKDKIEELNSLVAKKVAEAETLITERVKLEGDLHGWKEKERLLESRVSQLEEQVNSSTPVEPDLFHGHLNGDKARTNGEANSLNTMSQWTILAAGTAGAVAATVAVYICLAKHK